MGPANTTPANRWAADNQPRVAHPRALIGSENSVSAGQSTSHSLRNGVRRLAAKCWRRRFLLITPVLAMIPLSLAAALWFPRTYETSALLLLQESGRNNPFASEAVAPDVMQQKLPGLEALLKSEQVLGEATKAIYSQDARKLSDKDLPASIRELRNALSIELIGTDFLSIRLKGSKPDDLGRQLSTVLSNFLEALVFEPKQSAAQIILAKHRQEMDELAQTLESYQAKLTVTSPAQGQPAESLDSTREAQQAALQQQVYVLQQRLTSAREIYEGLAKKYPVVSAGSGSGILNAPGRIKIVDPPQDPRTSTTSRAKLFLAGIAAGILLAVALAWAADLLDTTVYDSDEFVSATGLPLLAVLPKRTASNFNSESSQLRVGRPSAAPGWLVRAAILIALAGAGYLIASDSTVQETVRAWLTWFVAPKTAWLVGALA